MTWDESDSDIETKFNALKEQETIQNIQLRQIRKYQININNLKMIQSSKTEDVEVDGEVVGQEIISYSLPLNFAGNEMDQSYRDEQKAALILNIEEFLGDDNE